MRKITQTEMAAALGITSAYMSELLSGKYPISRPLAEKLAERFDWKTYQQWRAADPKEIEKAFLAREYMEKVV